MSNPGAVPKRQRRAGAGARPLSSPPGSLPAPQPGVTGLGGRSGVGTGVSFLSKLSVTVSSDISFFFFSIVYFFLFF